MNVNASWTYWWHISCGELSMEANVITRSAIVITSMLAATPCQATRAPPSALSASFSSWWEASDQLIVRQGKA